ncbi:Solute carrier family 2 [Phytophthora cinnamomi]|uniref:Solute carrier family 2 n=1 Tax=Phytophthora cinnamomi TaxID=4785 RepID=UPI00355946A2|nr:Solute carrier family 2 [Phytophthora cinnamomi]
MPSEALTDPVYSEATTPKGADVPLPYDEAAERNVKPNWILYSSLLVALLQPFQSGWSSSQTNLSQYSNTDDCNARPVAEDTCLMFPGHSKLEWTFAVNAWIFGGMIGSLCCGHFSDLWGRRKLLFVNCIFMIAGAAIQTPVSNVWAFAISVTIGILFPAICFFFANTSSGWRYLAGFPVVLAVLFLLLAPSMCVESPAWLLMKGRREEAKQVITRLYGEENVYLALSWLESSSKPDPEQALVNNSAQEESLFSPKYRLPLACAVLLSCTQQLSGINAVFYYSNSIFEDAGISDPRVGTLIIDFVNIWPAFSTGFLAKRFGNRNLILWGIAGMFVMAVLMTVAFLVDVAALSVVFMALYVVAFGATLGPLVWVITADLFPDSVRATATSIGIGVNWLCNLIVGVSYPYIADAFDDYSYVPFVVLLAIFYALSLKLVPETYGKSPEEVQREFQLQHGAQ